MIDTGHTDQKHSEIGIPLMGSVAAFLETFRQRCTKEEQTLELELEKLHIAYDSSRQLELTKLREEISKLTVRLHQNETIIELLESKLNTQNNKLASKHHPVRFFTVWKTHTQQQGHNEIVQNLCVNHFKRKIIQRCFISWMKFHFDINISKERVTHMAKVDTIAKEIISRYESELAKMRSELTNTQNKLSHSNTQRQQLEVNMRRTLLQGMTAMNIETMASFKDSEEEIDS